MNQPIFTMTCQDLAERLQHLSPSASAKDVARTCMLLVTNQSDLSVLDDDAELQAAWHEAQLKLQFAADQHAAMTAELEALAETDPTKYSREQVWVLIRAIKVQSQMLQLYAGQPALDV